MSITPFLLGGLLMGLGAICWCFFTSRLVRLLRRQISEKSARFWLGPHDPAVGIPFGLLFAVGGAILAKKILSLAVGAEDARHFDSYLVVGWLFLPLPFVAYMFLVNYRSSQ
ncbi:MAG: hypothetical protein MUC83_17725 [Pirellula sp.]|jgi:hypothetical protein|nr:hypothetical protein [Pirellula sp.]